MTAAAGFGVADLAELLGRVPDPEPVGTVIARMQQVAGGLDRFADACGDASLIHDARVLATAARRAGRDFTTALTRLGRAETTTDTTDCAVMAATASGRLA
ncbi:MAG TPA: hypothetical protein VFP72_24505 [Kineosporiaceae bacterium]|nr:hypothetical protein [Kineosporiaceae bacterium]